MPQSEMITLAHWEGNNNNNNNNNKYKIKINRPNTTLHRILQPEFQKSWDVFLNLKIKDFQITLANILFTIEHR